MLSGDKGLSVTSLLYPADVHEFVQRYMTNSTQLSKHANDNIQHVLQTLGQSEQLTELYAHPTILKLLCETMESSHPDLNLINTRNSPAQLDSMWCLLLKQFMKHHAPLRALHNDALLTHHQKKVAESSKHSLDISLDQLRGLYINERLILGYFAYSMMVDEKNHSDLTAVLAWINQRTKMTAQSEPSDHLPQRAPLSEDQLTAHIVSLGVLIQHPGSKQYAFYHEKLKHYFAAHFIAACLMQPMETLDPINNELVSKIEGFIARQCENTFLDDFWFQVYAAFPPYTGAHARAEFSKISITTRSECTLHVSNLFKLTALALPENYYFQLAIIGANQLSIKSQKAVPSVNDKVFDFFNNVYIHFANKEKCSFIAGAKNSELIFTSKSQQELQNIIYAFKHALGDRLRMIATPLNLFTDNTAAVQSIEQHQPLATKHN